MPEPATYSVADHNGLKLHLCDCSDDHCTFYSCNITDKDSLCEVAGCDGKITLSENYGEPVKCDTCTFTSPY